MIHNLVCEFADRFADCPQAAVSKPAWAALKQSGTELWLDTGDIAEAGTLWAAEFSGLTTNNTWLNVEVQKGIYDELIAAVAQRLKNHVDGRQLEREIAFVLNAVHGLRLVRRFGCKVSVELHTDLAHDIQGTLDYAARFRALGSEQFIIKVPMTPAGLIAVRRLSAAGTPVNLTVGFSARQNFLAAMLARPSYVNVFVGRIAAFLDASQLAPGIPVAVYTTLASQHAIREAQQLCGAHVRQIAASMRAIELIPALAGVDVHTINTTIAQQFANDYRGEAFAARVSSKLPPPPFPVATDGPDLRVLWEIPESFRRATLQLSSMADDKLSPETIRDTFAVAGHADFLPNWTMEDQQQAQDDGVVPKWSNWCQRSTSNQIGLDALMGLSVLMAFVKDQAAMDERIRSLITSN